ncbi:MAG: hypothetical protein ACOYXU_09325 [Nitrospirota bacterium]
MVINTGDINIGNTINAGNRANISDRMATLPADRARSSQNNLYNRPENRARVADRASATRDLQQARPATGRENNVYTDRNGNVARRTGDQWETRNQGAWNPEPSVGDRATQAPSRDSRPATPPAAASTPSFDRGDMNRSYQSRQSGAAQERMRPPPRVGGGGARRR